MIKHTKRGFMARCDGCGKAANVTRKRIGDLATHLGNIGWVVNDIFLFCENCKGGEK